MLRCAGAGLLQLERARCQAHELASLPPSRRPLFAADDHDLRRNRDCRGDLHRDARAYGFGTVQHPYHPADVFGVRHRDQSRVGHLKARQRLGLHGHHHHPGAHRDQLHGRVRPYGSGAQAVDYGCQPVLLAQPDGVPAELLRVHPLQQGGTHARQALDRGTTGRLRSMPGRFGRVREDGRGRSELDRLQRVASGKLQPAVLFGVPYPSDQHRRL